MTTLADLHRPGIATHFARVLVARATALGVAQDQLLQAVRLNRDLLDEGRVRISPVQLGALMRLVWRELDDELMGFGAGAHRFGTFALMARQMVDSATLGEALRYSVRFYNLTSPALRWELREGGHCELALRLAEPEADPDHLLEEFMLLIWHRFCNWLIGERMPLLRTAFRFAAPAHRAEYRLMFPGPVQYRQDISSIQVDSAWLRAPVIRSRRDLRRYLQRLPDEWFVKQIFADSVSARVLRALADAQADLSLEALAGQWHMSSRTLHRQLKREGSSFRRLREQYRRDRAEAMLLEGNGPIGEVAQSLAMTEPAFSRAFKLWTGMSPLAYRRARRR
ncbi:AraC family transcriptional regulator [Parahaliea mediterranea]|uniref:AraC family transcriptional regulator n=1 Tax=Parahaliea mediterranea TaxID=651086 RepID=UPI000E2E938B|nr:AraC family transcriptional regulator [Parahaliea mediterranea]